MIRTENISKSFGNLEVLKDINLHIKEREIVSIVGASGAGKTTLLQIIGTLGKQTSGKLIIDNKDISNFSENKLSDFRNGRPQLKTEARGAVVAAHRQLSGD